MINEKESSNISIINQRVIIVVINMIVIITSVIIIVILNLMVIVNITVQIVQLLTLILQLQRDGVECGDARATAERFDPQRLNEMLD